MNKVIGSAISDLAFNKYRKNVYSQCGEDGIIQYLLGLIQIDVDYFVEFGAWDGKHLSNCANLVDKGWSGCFIEGDHARYLDLQRTHGHNDRLALVNAYVSSQGESSLAEILKDRNAPKEFAVLSIDIDGNDYHVWKGLTFFNPKICIIEYNPTIPGQVQYVQENNKNVNFGSSLSALADLAREKGYDLVAATELNGFFVRNDLCLEHSIPVYSVFDVKSVEYETYIFHGYNGEIKIMGQNSLLWHGVSIDPKDMQVLPVELQKFPVGQGGDYYDKLEKIKNSKR